MLNKSFFSFHNDEKVALFFTGNLFIFLKFICTFAKTFFK